MSDPTDGRKAETPKPTPNEPTAPRSSAGAGIPAKGKALDLDRYRTKAAEAAPAPTEKQVERERYPLVHWSDLAGIPNLRIVDLWLNTSKPKPATATTPAKPAYDYVGANVRLAATLDQPAATVTVLTGEDTSAGARLRAEYLAGRFDAAISGHDPDGVLVHVLNKASPDPSKAAKPYSVLTFG